MINSTRFVLLGLAVFALCAGVQAQSASPTHTSTESLPDGHVRLHIENLSNHAITAVAVVGTRIFGAQRDTSVRFFDNILSSQNPKPLLPGNTVDFQLFGPQPPPEKTTRSVEVKAVLFDDGDSWGDRLWVSKLLNRRVYAHAHPLTLLSEIADVKAANASRGDIMQRLQRDRDRMTQSGRDVDEKQMADIVFTNTLLTFGRTNQPGGPEISIQESLSEATGWLTAFRGRLEKAKPPIER